MTGTMRRNGAKVEAAFWRVWNERSEIKWSMVTVGEVAKEAGCSKPTAQKYLQMLVDARVLYEMQRDMRYCAKNTQRSFVPFEVKHG